MQLPILRTVGAISRPRFHNWPVRHNPYGAMVGGNITGSTIALFPGDILKVIQINFDWLGPARTLLFGWAIKPSAGLLSSIDFNNGASIVNSPTMFNYQIFQVSAVSVVTAQSLSVSIPITIPAPGTYKLPDGATNVQINSGPFDVWTWFTDYSALQLAPPPPTGTPPASIFTQKYIYWVDTLASVGSIGGVAGSINKATYTVLFAKG